MPQDDGPTLPSRLTSPLSEPLGPRAAPQVGGGGPRKRSKVLTHEQLLERRRGARAMGLNVVQCHGCFDIVHPGHVRHLKQAKGHGDFLLVTITGDSAFSKRPGGPLIPEELRAENLAELDCVDWVYIDQRATAAELLDEVQPDVYIKGREYEQNADPRFALERQTVEKHGGRVVFSSGDVVFSSTALIAALERSVDPYHARLSQLLEMPELDGPVLSALVSQFRGQRVLVVGEAISDVYVLCDRPEVASESPVMTLRPLEKRSYDGGAAIIARHLAALGARPTLLTGLPESPAGEAMRLRLEAEGVTVHAVRTDVALAEKQRFLVGAQKVMKINALEPIVLDAARQDALVALAKDLAGESDGAILADFGNGLLTSGVIARLIEAIRPRVRVLTGDVSGRRAGLLSMREMDLLCPSEIEAREALHLFDDSLPGVAWGLLTRTGAKQTIITLGADGLIAFDRLAGADAPGDPFRSRVRGQHVPALSGHPVDPLGCGDALLATATLTLLAGGSLLAGGFLGAIAAATEAQRLGNVPISAMDVRHGLVRLHSARLTITPDAEPMPVRPASARPAAAGAVAG